MRAMRTLQTGLQSAALRQQRLIGSFHDFKGVTLGAGTRAAPTPGAPLDFASLKGKVVLINNVATL